MTTTTTTTAKEDRKTHAVDIRIFFLIITTAMGISFLTGVLLGPSSPTDIFPGAISSAIANSALQQEIKVKTARRSRTKHASEIGERLPDLNERHVNFQQPVLEDFGDGSGAIQYAVDSDGGIVPRKMSQEEHLPSGQHLMVDLMNVEADFLNSEQRLADAMVESIKTAGLTLLSYHCHSLLPAGVSCVGVLLESHISFHTWPEEGVITLDLFTCGPKPLLPVVPDLERLFGIPRNKANSTTEKEEIISKWSHELRGFRNKNDKSNSYLDNSSDLATWVFSPLLFGTKKQVVSVNSPHQRIDIWDYLSKESTPSYDDAIKFNLTEGDPRWLTSEIVTPDRLLFLDGNIQSARDSEREYHETLVHPAMFAHPNPKHVAVIGGGEGATVREILKHNTVESVVMIEVDEMLVNIAREHLAYMSNCSDIIGLADSCFDDSRATIIYEDATQWFKDHYGKLATKEKAVPSFDVIILDAFDPKQGSEMYKDTEFLDALYASLSQEGVFSLHIGNHHTIHDPKPDMGVYAPREQFFNLLESHPSTAAMIVYEEAHCGFEEPHAFLTVCKDTTCKSRWYAQPVAVDDEIYDRIKRTKSNKPALIHFDGATQHSFQFTPRAWETVYCRREPEPFECSYRGLDMSKKLFEMADEEEEEEGSFEIKTQTINGEEIKSVYATVDIPKGSYIMPSDVASSVVLSDDIMKGLKDNIAVKETGEVTVIKNFLDFVDKHGHPSMSKGTKLNYVEVGGSTFIRKSQDPKEINVGRWLPEHPSGKIPVWSPLYDRHMMAFDVFIVATRDIKAGEEVVRPIKY
eukprot:CAMPEP_0176494040 /NCGR_PEP_ID=MMETSP0200_2-20121128/9872_1 /TAXON_ID=947934 /ORGANISM="Chaetoceros sp., Strain GSL56" /LENGTH=803 /DNA_ID=CAMNT_0017891747 /DNA_START=276 /DNA_END=2687 /DNA_ORIENTATION=+